MINLVWLALRNIKELGRTSRLRPPGPKGSMNEPTTVNASQPIPTPLPIEVSERIFAVHKSLLMGRVKCDPGKPKETNFALFVGGPIRGVPERIPVGSTNRHVGFDRIGNYPIPKTILE